MGNSRFNVLGQRLREDVVAWAIFNDLAQISALGRPSPLHWPHVLAHEVSTGSGARGQFGGSGVQEVQHRLGHLPVHLLAAHVAVLQPPPTVLPANGGNREETVITVQEQVITENRWVITLRKTVITMNRQGYNHDKKGYNRYRMGYNRVRILGKHAWAGGRGPRDVRVFLLIGLELRVLELTLALQQREHVAGH